MNPNSALFSQAIIRLLCRALLAGAAILPSAVMAMEPCEPAAEGGAGIWVSPLVPKAGVPVKVLAVATDGPLDALVLTDGDGAGSVPEARALGGPPWSLATELPELVPGSYRVAVRRDGKDLACVPLEVAEAGASSVVRRRPVAAWNEATEAFYSAWIEGLFDAPPADNLNFSSLEPVLRDARRNFLHNYLGLAEDKSLPATPDCADLPYTLRAYFAWKVGLPIGFRPCSRGSAKAPPRCGAPVVKTDFTRGVAPASVYRSVSARVADGVHSGTARTALNDEATDLYPVELRREALRPGTVYADPYGHVLVLAHWVPQNAGSPGMLLAVDAQPDNSVSRKRFWEGTFLYADVASAGPGFKAFRPLIRTGSGAVRALANGELTAASGFAAFSPEQNRLSPDDFYARMGKLINPAGLAPRQAYGATLDALVEQLETRVVSVGNGDSYFRKNPAAVIPMPEGAAIFETIGPWEDFSTPSRDLRLIIAMNVLTGLPQQLVRHPELFVMNGMEPEQVAADIESLHDGFSQERKIRYTRSDGSPWELTVAEVLERKPAFEMAYNPNDCAEVRWGARPGTAEYSTCRRHAPAAQRARMEHYRDWFRQARRPTR